MTMNRYINRILLAAAALFVGIGTVKGQALASDGSVTKADVKWFVSDAKPTAAPSGDGAASVSVAAGKWVVVKVTPNSGYWIYKDLITLQVVGSAGGAQARPQRAIKLPENPVALSGNQADGTGYYYYQIPAECTADNGYTKVIIAGEAIEKIDLSTAALSGTTVTTADRADGWKVEITLSAVSFTYNGSAQGPTISSFTLKKGSDVFSSTIADHVSISDGQTNAGNYNATLTAVATGCLKNSFSSAAFSITKKDLTITANNKTISFGDEAANDGVSYSGFVNNETEAMLGGTLIYSYKTKADGTGDDYTKESLAGTYYIIPSGLTSTNYDIAFAAGKLTVTPLIGVVVTITGHNDKAAFDGKEHSVTGYDVEISNLLYTESDFTFSGTAKAARTEVGTTYMGLAEVQFTNNNPNFASVTFKVTDGYQEITSVDEVIVTITGHTNTADYDGKEHSVTGYEFTSSNALYTESDFTFSGTAEAKCTDAGKTMMGLDALQFTNTNTNFSNVIFIVNDGYQEISPIAATVTITGHNDVVTYDGTEHSVSGYEVKISNNLYHETDFTFSGTAEAKRTDEGKTMMGLTADQFTNNSTNFNPVTFNVTDGYMQITAVTDVVVTITGHNNTADYDGTEHSVTGYEVKISNPLYTESDFTFSGTAEAKRTDAGKTAMGLDASQFTNKNTAFPNVVFNVSDGYQEISPITATVTIKGHRDIVAYDGTEHKVTGYDVTFSNTLYTEADFTFSGTAEAARTDVGKTDMGLAVDQFTNTNPNFSTVTFNVTDGGQTINKKEAVLTVTVTPKTYDGKTGAEVSVTVDTRVKGESLTITGLTGTFDDANAGTDKTVMVNSSKAVVTVGDNTKLDNYEVVYPAQTNGTITQRPVVVSGITAQDKDYDGTTDATLVYDNAQLDGLLAGDKLTVTATGKFENAEAGENKTVLISDLTLGGESVGNYILAAEGQQTTTKATIRPEAAVKTITLDGSGCGIRVVRNDTGDEVPNVATLSFMGNGTTLRIDKVDIFNPDPVNGIAAGVTVYIPATLKDNDKNELPTYGVGSDIIVTDANVPVTDIYMPDTEEMINVAKQAFRLITDESVTARIHTSLPLLDDYALTAGLKAEYEDGHVMTTITPTTQYWTLSTGVDVVVPESAMAYICQADGLDAVIATAITSTKANVFGQERVIVKANNGVMMGSESEKGGTFDLIVWPSADRPSGSKPSTEDARSYDGNMLVPSTVKTHFEPSEYYILFNNTYHELEPDDDTFVSPCKAVLRKSNPNMARSLSIHMDTNGILSVYDDSHAEEGKWYSLDGRRLSGKPTAKGLYIHNGKKTFIK